MDRRREHAMERVTGLAVVALLVVGGALGVILLPPVVWPDTAIPASVAPFIPTARAALLAEATDGLELPLHLTFLEARCAADGSVALIFEEHRPPYAESRYAYAVRGSMPTAVDDAWAGGFRVPGPVVADPEFIHLMGPDPGPCP
jgi:hypothetical protein